MMKLERKIISMLCAAIMAMGVLSAPVYATTNCYLYEDFEADDFINTDESITPPAHSGGASETWYTSSTTENVDAEFSIETETSATGVENSFLRYKSNGTGQWRTGLEVRSDHVAQAAAPIYNYTISYDLTIDDWSHVDATGNVIDHASRYLHIQHGGNTTACAKLYDGYLHAATEDAGNTGLGGTLTPLVALWDTDTGVGTKHHLRWEFRQGANGEGLVTIYVDGECVVESAVHAQTAVALPTSGKYFGIRAEDNVIGALRTSIKLDNIRLEYSGAPASSATPRSYLYEDFESVDFMGIEENIVPPYHGSGATETWYTGSTTADVDAEFSIESEEDEAGAKNRFLRYKSNGTGQWRTGLEVRSTPVAEATSPIYNYSVSYDIKIDDWSHVDTEGNVVDHASRYLHIQHGGNSSATAKLNAGKLYAVTADAGNTGLNGALVPLATLWDVGSGVGEKHNLRWVFRQGADGEGLVDIYVDGACVLESALHAQTAVALPTSGKYFGIRAEDNVIGALRTSIQIDNIHLEYEGAPISASQPFDAQVKVLHERIETYEDVYLHLASYDHDFYFTIENSGTEAEEVYAELNVYNDDGGIIKTETATMAVDAGEVLEGNLYLSITVDVNQSDAYRVGGRVYKAGGTPLCEEVFYKKSELDWSLYGLEAIFNGETMTDWLASLYDPATGGMFYSKSAKDHPETFGPHIESTYGGMYSALPYMNERAKAALGNWILNMQDPGTGYFIEPEFDIATASAGKKGRDNGYALAILNYLGLDPLYPTVAERLEASQNSATPTLMAVGDTIEESLGSWEDWKTYLDRQNWNDNAVWGTAHNLESNAGLIVQAGYKKKTAEYIAEKINPATGMLGTGLSYNTMSGTLKSLWAFGSDSIAYPHIEKMYENALTLAETQEPSDMAQIINLPVGMRGARNSYAASGTVLPASVNETLEDIIPRLIKVLTTQLLRHKKADGCFGYSKVGGQAFSQGAYVSLGQEKDAAGNYLYDESDINGNGLAMTCRSVLYEFGGKVAPVLIAPQDLAEKLNERWFQYHKRTADASVYSIVDILTTKAVIPQTVWTLRKIGE